MKGQVHSIETLGAADGPGVRFTVFVQGCPLRCVCCHNPDTWEQGGTEMTADELVTKAERYREYFGNVGGITVSGGEPLLQAGFVTEIFKKAKERGINTCLDTSGCVLNDEVKSLLEVTDLVMLDIKYTTPEDYLKYVGCELSQVLKFLGYLQQKAKCTWIRQVIIPGLNDTKENIARLNDIILNHNVVEKIELLPFKKICEVKYKNMGLRFPLEDTPEPTLSRMAELEAMLNII